MISFGERIRFPCPFIGPPQTVLRDFFREMFFFSSTNSNAAIRRLLAEWKHSDQASRWRGRLILMSAAILR